MNTTSDLRRYLEREKGRQSTLKKQLKTNISKIKKLKETIEHTKEAQQIIHAVAIDTQNSIKIQLSELGSMALHSVLDEPYNIDIEFKSGRGKVEVYVNFERDGKLIEPLFGTGGGASDVGGIGMKLSCFAITNNIRNLLIMDEPLKFLQGGDMPKKGAEMLKTIPNKLGIQSLIVSHDADLIDSADNVIETGKKKYISFVKNTIDKSNKNI